MFSGYPVDAPVKNPWTRIAVRRRAEQNSPRCRSSVSQAMGHVGRLCLRRGGIYSLQSWPWVLLRLEKVADLRAAFAGLREVFVNARRKKNAAKGGVFQVSLRNQPASFSRRRA
jgi:hypothetical protein